VIEGKMKLTVDAEKPDTQLRRQLSFRKPPPASVQQPFARRQGGRALGELHLGAVLR